MYSEEKDNLRIFFKKLTAKLISSGGKKPITSMKQDQGAVEKRNFRGLCFFQRLLETKIAKIF